MNIKLWIATYVDYGETCDGKARVLGIYKSKEEAEDAVRADMEQWEIDRPGEDIYFDFDKMSANFYVGDKCCEWNIEKHYIDGQLEFKLN